ncbi:dual OB domain-containing protein [Allochromatium palmeri]|uniref:Dual OB-containing domain-containing protein n=1 Tax=Allochromatium palmeri TaxID=231048 RepID=A0A6N8EJC6_9GAMM|nr:hypothetical protein [Allochromatium palmeri]MTW23128.1 hypothetical protein [Allochromatium palmeri]
MKAHPTQPQTKTLVVLANSCKNNGRCLAGKALANDRFGAWIRPVSAHPTGALTLEHQAFNDSTTPALLDVVTVPVRRPAPLGFQSENHLIHSQYYWSRVGRLDAARLPELVDPVAPLWINGHSTVAGCNDRVPEDRLAELDHSLILIGPVTVWLHVAWEKLRARFVHQAVTYDLVVTDPDLKAAYAGRPDGVLEQQPNSFVCVSLAPPWNGYAYKLAAAILTP